MSSTVTLSVSQDRINAIFKCGEEVTTREKFAYLADALSDQLIELCPGEQPAPEGYTLRAQHGVALQEDTWRIFGTRLARQLEINVETALSD